MYSQLFKSYFIFQIKKWKWLKCIKSYKQWFYRIISNKKNHLSWCTHELVNFLANRYQTVHQTWTNCGTDTVSYMLKVTNELSVKILENQDHVCHASALCLSCSVTCRINVQSPQEMTTPSGWVPLNHHQWWLQPRDLKFDHTSLGKKWLPMVIFYYCIIWNQL